MLKKKTTVLYFAQNLKRIEEKRATGSHRLNDRRPQNNKKSRT